MSAAATEETMGVLTGPLPDDFLVLSRPKPKPSNLSIVLNEATFKKDSSFFGKMSLYATVQVGSEVLTGPTDPSCGTNPVWNFPANFILKGPKPKRCHIKIFENGMISDSFIAVGSANISPVFELGKLEMHVTCYDVDKQEAGRVRITVTNTERPADSERRELQQRQQQQQQQQQLTPEQNAEIIAQQEASLKAELDQLKSMFPQFDEDVIESIYTMNNSDFESTLNTVLGMTE